MNQNDSPTEIKNKELRAYSALEQVLEQARQRGFYGTAGLVLSIQDGHIQHIRLNVERMMK